MARGFTHPLDGCIPDASLRVIDDAKQSLLVLLIDHQSEVGDDVHDLLVIEERASPVDAEGEADTTEDLLEDTTLRIRSIEYRYRAVASASLKVRAVGKVFVKLSILSRFAPRKE